MGFFSYLCDARRGVFPCNLLFDMDIDLLSKMVGELILDSDEVALPGVGTFVAELMPSTFSDKGYTINPPYRRLSFRQRESSDNRLVELYARSNDVDLQTAASIMGTFLKELKETLKVRKTIVFPGLGRLRATRENNFFFIPDEDLNIFPEGFGLEPVSLKTHVETEDEMRAAVASLQQILDEPAAEEQPVVVPESDAVKPEEEPVVTEAEPEPVAEGPLPEPVKPEAEAAVKEEPETTVKEEPKASLKEGTEVVKRGGRRWWIPVAAVLGAIVLFLTLFVLLAHIAPVFIDSILYTPEELDIIHRI